MPAFLVSKNCFCFIFFLKYKNTGGKIMKRTNWSKTTLDPQEAMLNLTACIGAGHHAWIEIQKNGEQEFPIQKKNPLLDNPFYWTMMVGQIRNEKDLKEMKFFNETEKDLTYNWTHCFGTKEAIQAYQERGEILEGLIQSSGICHPVRIQDANYYREKITGDGYKYGYWMTRWRPITGVPYWVTDTSIKDVFVICYDDDIPAGSDTAALLKNAAAFLLKYAEQFEN